MFNNDKETDIHELQAGNNGLKKKPRGTPFKKGNKFGCGSKRDKESLSLPNYIKRKTKDGKVLTDFYTGILKEVEDSNEDNPPMYKGMRITAELATKAVDWLSKNGWGTPSQRKPPDEKPKRTQAELLERMRYLIRKQAKRAGFDDVKAERVIEALIEIGY